MTRTLVIAALAAGALAPRAEAKVQTEEIRYEQGETALKGFLAWDDAGKGKRPGILVIHEWWGHNQHARQQAQRFAKAGYVAFALDMYGDGKVAKHPKDAMAFMQEATKDPAVVSARFDAALGVLKQQPQVDPEKIGAVGYCFGGGVATSMARAGKDLDAVATFHGVPKPAGPALEPDKVKGKAFLFAVGAADPMIPKEQAEGVAKELEDAGAKVKLVFYPKARHAFTNPDADKVGMDALAYDEQADRKSFDEARKFFRETFGK
jgi:dienelactone hydrolase